MPIACAVRSVVGIVQYIDRQQPSLLPVKSSAFICH